MSRADCIKIELLFPKQKDGSESICKAFEVPRTLHSQNLQKLKNFSISSKTFPLLVGFYRCPLAPFHQTLPSFEDKQFYFQVLNVFYIMLMVQDSQNINLCGEKTKKGFPSSVSGHKFNTWSFAKH